MGLNRERIIRKVESCLKRTACFQEIRKDDYPDEENYQLLYVLIKGTPAAPQEVLAFAGIFPEVEDVLSFSLPLGKETQDVACKRERFTDFDIYLFPYLESGFELLWMSDESHCAVWGEICDLKDEIHYEKGMQKYLQFCKRNGINKEWISTRDPYVTQDVMTLYKPQKTCTKKKGMER